MTWWDQHVPGHEDAWLRHVGGPEATTRQLARDSLQAQGCTSVADIGCGMAMDAGAFEAMGIHYTGIDSCAWFCANEIAQGVDVRFATAEETGLQSDSVDGAYCRHTLEHLPKLEPALTEMVRVARKAVVIVLGEQPGDRDRLSYDPARDLHWNCWGRQSYAACLRKEPKALHWYWIDVESKQGRGRGNETILVVSLNERNRPVSRPLAG